MSNAGRPRTGMKKCPHCGNTNRDSNGQCRCRNAAYRALSGAPKATADKARRVYDAALRQHKGSVDKALADMREEFPSLARRAASKATRLTAAQKKAAVTKAEKQISNAKAEATKKVEPARYILHVDDGFTDPYPYARKDAAVKNGVRSGGAWHVTYKGKTVAASDDLL